MYQKYWTEVGAWTPAENCTYYTDTLKPGMIASLRWALSACRLPVQLSDQPTVRDLVVSVDGDTLTIAGVADDTMNGAEVDDTITGVRYVINTPSWEGGVTASLSFTATANPSIADISDTIDISALSPGEYIIFVEADDDGLYNWGTPTAALFTVE
jgi:hypothetical protein